jgi:hypothetical protein
LLVGGPSRGSLTAAFQEDAEVARGGGMTPLVRAAVRGLGEVGRAGVLEQAAMVERASGVTTRIRARVCRLR